MEGNYTFERVDSEPQTKKKKSGKVSPRHLFGSLTEDTVNKIGGSQVKKYTFSRTTWKPPLKVNYSFNENNHIGSDENKANYTSTQSPQPTGQSSIGDQNENYFSSDNKQSFIKDSKPFNSDDLVDNTNLNLSRTIEDNEEHSLDTSSYIDYCVEIEVSESMKKDCETVHTSPIETLDQSQENMEIIDIEPDDPNNDKNSIGSQGCLPKLHENSIQKLEVCNTSENHKSIHPSPLQNTSLLTEAFKQNEKIELEQYGYSNNSKNIMELKNEKLSLCDNKPDNFLNEHVPEIHNISSSSIEENEYTLHKNSSQVGIQQECTENENSLNNNIVKNNDKETKELLSENNKTCIQENEFPSNVSNFASSDPFLATVSNSQFLRLENEIYSSAKDVIKSSSELRERKLEAAKKNILSLGNQTECQKTIQVLRRMINDIEELNKSVVKATMQLRNQNKALSSH